MIIALITRGEEDMGNKRIKKMLAGAALCSLMIAPLLLNMEEAFATEQSTNKQAGFGVVKRSNGRIK